MTINLADHVMNLKGRDYLPVAPRIVAFREANPSWSIMTEPAEIRDLLYCKAIVLDDVGRVVATAHKVVTSFAGGAFEKAETGAIGRALSLCGYGTLAAQDMDEGDDIADAPVAKPSGYPVKSPAKPAAKAPTSTPPPPAATHTDSAELWAVDPSVAGPADDQVADMIMAIGACQTEAELTKLGKEIKALSPSQQTLLRGPYAEALGIIRQALMVA